MGEYDSATWSAVGVALTAVGLVLSVAVWRRRGVASGVRGVAWSLLPLAAAMTGLLRVVWEVADSVSSWAARLVFSPTVWAGIVVGGISATLFVVSGFLRRRTPEGRARKERKERKAAGPGSAPAAVTASGPKPARTGSAPAEDDDMADIEAILRKHGIS
ncbi:MAG TPA: hypothetical protein VFH10_13810 [Nocardioides sp.]|uniref:hypothetical protein n=1 Tax=Nocardioides sp. TaxID=35761 RepID=UPI002D80F197|nr:hypothetical protein [Nocardioides sp.]HET6653715.1 hypothetical protein [Nocardioides sp.]